MYDIVRFYKDGHRRTIRRGVTLEQAQRHCNDPETFSGTATSPAAKAETRRHGEWFDGYMDRSGREYDLAEPR